MNDSTPIYSSRVTKVYLGYLNQNYPSLDVGSILKYAGMNRYEVDDPGHWFTQAQVDRFHDIIVEKTGNPHISKEAGRYASSSEKFGTIHQYILGLISPALIYLSIGKVYPRLSKGVKTKTKKLKSNKIQIIITPLPGVDEKPYQCENRTGMFEAVYKLFSGQYAKIEHPSCYHNGDESCRYIITWDKTPALNWKRVRNYTLTLSIIIAGSTLLLLPHDLWTISTLILALITSISAFYSEHLEKKDLIKTIKTQGERAEDHLIQLNIRYNNALLVQEIGKATSTIVKTDVLANSIMKAMAKRLDFDRGLIMLANKQKSRLIYTAGYGYQEEEENLLQQTEFHLDNSGSKNRF
jgi:hypothetical protein